MNISNIDKLDSKDLQRIIRAIDRSTDRNRAPVRAEIIFLSQTGLRVGETQQLTAGHIKKRSFLITGKGNKERTVYLSNELRQYLKAYIRELDLKDSDPLFISMRGKAIDNSNFFRRLKKYAGLSRLKKAKVYPHALRHFFIENCIHAGINETTVRYLAGHALATTDVYYIEHENSIREKLSKLWIY